MSRKAIVLEGLGFGDEGKGTITDWLCLKYGAHTVVRTGGPQAFHTVMKSSGVDHIFSQFGSGTLCGTRTFLSSKMLVHPLGIYEEEKILREIGISNPYDLMTIDENCLVISPFQTVANRLREISRGSERYGSVGKGVGETIADSEIVGWYAIRVRDFKDPEILFHKLRRIQDLKIEQLKDIVKELSSQSGEVQEWLDLLYQRQTIEDTVELFKYLGEKIKIVDSSHLGEILKEGTVIFEPSQGALLDRWQGFHPYTTKVNPKIESALELLADQGYDGDVKKVGIIRCYHTRHGNGPFVVEDKDVAEQLPDMHNWKNAWQGEFRVGHFDTVAFKYAIQISGGKEAFDRLAVTCVDRLSSTPAVDMDRLDLPQICESYTYTGKADGLAQYFEIVDDKIVGIKVRPNSRDEAQLQYQERLGQLLRECKPNLVETVDYEDRNQSKFLDKIQETAGIPIAITSYGPFDTDKKEIVKI